jgi:hypothetical protein
VLDHLATDNRMVGGEGPRECLFELGEARAVLIQTDERNERSRAAIERLGGTLDGVLRADRLGADGTVQETAICTMLACEWPAHRQCLLDRLGK